MKRTRGEGVNVTGPIWPQLVETYNTRSWSLRPTEDTTGWRQVT